MTFNIANYSVDSKGKPFLLLHLHQPLAENAQILVESEDITKVVEIYAEKKKRSLTANSYMWLLLNKLAIKLNTTDEELYLDFLRKYGTKDYIAAPIESEEILKRMYKIVEVVKDCTINSTKAVTFRLIRGSSKYDSKEFSILLDAVVEECKSQGIETETPEKLKLLLDNWRPE